VLAQAGRAQLRPILCLQAGDTKAEPRGLVRMKKEVLKFHNFNTCRLWATFDHCPARGLFGWMLGTCARLHPFVCPSVCTACICLSISLHWPPCVGLSVCLLLLLLPLCRIAASARCHLLGCCVAHGPPAAASSKKKPRLVPLPPLVYLSFCNALNVPVDFVPKCHRISK
jgi:hypothetical protein